MSAATCVALASFQLPAGVAGVRAEGLPHGGADGPGVDHHVVPPVETGVLERDGRGVSGRVHAAGAHHVVAGFLLLGHQVPGAEVVTGEAPVALGVKAAEAAEAAEAQ